MVDQRKDIICAYTSGADISLSVYSISKSCWSISDEFTSSLLASYLNPLISFTKFPLSRTLFTYFMRIKNIFITNGVNILKNNVTHILPPIFTNQS
jgi:hypothetical protein